MERMRQIPRDSNDNGVAAMFVYHNNRSYKRRNGLLIAHQHGGDDLVRMRSKEHQLVVSKFI